MFKHLYDVIKDLWTHVFGGFFFIRVLFFSISYRDDTFVVFLLPISAVLLQDMLLYRASITSTLRASVIEVMFFIWCFVYKRSNTWKRGMCSFNYDNARKLSYFQLQIFHNDTRWNKSDFLEYILRANFDSCFVGMKNVYFCMIFFSIHNGVLDINSVFFSFLLTALLRQHSESEPKRSGNMVIFS